ncbi:hypothetical protein ACH427_30610 [Streptomyces sp. NPDC020379]|uniref:hypothetical protein n=1 Tax=Streptomyces sp. NPDC020379 TaxID=3365071 RepID=UPI00379E81E1
MAQAHTAAGHPAQRRATDARRSDSVREERTLAGRAALAGDARDIFGRTALDRDLPPFLTTDAHTRRLVRHETERS